jgi:hypothetical protein
MGFEYDLVPTKKGLKLEMEARVNGHRVKTTSYFYEKREPFVFTELDNELVGGRLPGENEMSVDR